MIIMITLCNIIMKLAQVCPTSSESPSDGSLEMFIMSRLVSVTMRRSTAPSGPTTLFTGPALTSGYIEDRDWTDLTT